MATPKSLALYASPRLLAGGNPQIAKGYGDAPVQAYIAALTDWKQDAVRRIDALVTEHVPGVRKAVKWNSPMYGVNEEGWFLNLHVMTRYVKLGFLQGAMLAPPPPVESKMASVRYLHVAPETPLDETQFIAWVQAAAALPMVKM